ncbi:DEAD-box ATP-dependent RNA helicase 52C-like isoform X2 [Carex rostrata]
MLCSGTSALCGTCFLRTRRPVFSNHGSTLDPLLAMSSPMTYEVKKVPSTQVAYPPPRRRDNFHAPSLLSDIFLPEKDLSSLPSNEGINFNAYEDIPVESNGREVPPPVNSFFEMDLGSHLELNIKQCGYKLPTPVQKHAMPIIMAGRDLMACAQTGSGKTAAFCLPIIAGIHKGRDSFRGQRGARSGAASPVALIICPTRELVSQIHDEVEKYANRTSVRVAVAYGGVPIFHQLRSLQGGVDILVATPGRLVDLIDRGKVSLQNVKYLTLDEADRMLDMGFEPQIRKIIEETDMPPSRDRQTMLFSATFPSEIKRLATDFLSNYVYLTVGKVGSSTDLITQKVVDVSNMDKKNYLIDILRSQSMNAAHEVPLTLVFVQTKRGADLLERFLYQNGFPATSIHGDRSQREREQALSSFKRGSISIMIATDVASRGIDVPNVAHVINYDFPKNIDSYVHRIGRTGRAGKSGLATAFFDHTNQSMAKELADVMEETKQEVPGWLLQFGPSNGNGNGRRNSGRPRNGNGNGRRNSVGPRNGHRSSDKTDLQFGPRNGGRYSDKTDLQFGSRNGRRYSDKTDLQFGSRNGRRYSDKTDLQFGPRNGRRYSDETDMWGI